MNWIKLFGGTSRSVIEDDVNAWLGEMLDEPGFEINDFDWRVIEANDIVRYTILIQYKSLSRPTRAVKEQPKKPEIKLPPAEEWKDGSA